MSQYLVLSRIDIQNANAIAGLTWGFPAITQFLGFSHALNRKLSQVYNGHYDIHLSGCAVICHTHHSKVYQPKKHADFEFLQSKNPPVLAKHKNSSPSIIEEGKMNLSISLIIEIEKALSLSSDAIKTFEDEVKNLIHQTRIAGGSVLRVSKVKYLSASTGEQESSLLRQVKKMTMPGFVLLDRKEYLAAHYQSLLENNQDKGSKLDLIDAWLDFSAMVYKAVPHLADENTTPDESTPADWEYVPKPNSGYLVPIMSGYKAISDVYDPGEVLNTRDEKTPACFVEAVHSVGEWQSVHRISCLKQTTWRYQHEGHWYLCQQERNDTDPDDLKKMETQTVDINQALNFF